MIAWKWSLPYSRLAWLQTPFTVDESQQRFESCRNEGVKASSQEDLLRWKTLQELRTEHLTNSSSIYIPPAVNRRPDFVMSAEYGNSAGGRMSIVFKSGTND
jgi:hypothetical protein